MKPMSGASSAPSGPLPDSLSSLFMSPVAVSKLNEIFQNAPSPSAPQKSATSSRGVSGSSVGPTETKELDRVEDIFRELLNQRFQVWRQQCVPFLGLLISTTRRRSTTSTVDMNGELGAGNCVPGSPRSDGPSSSPGVIDSSYFISAPSSSLLSPYLSPSLPAFTTMTSALLQGIDEKLFPFFFEFSMQVANGALAPSKAVDFLSRRLLPLTLFHFLLIATDLRRSEVLAVSASPSGVESPNSSHSTRTAGSSSERSSTDAGEDTSSAGQDASCLELLTIDASLRNCFRSLPCSEKTINSEAAVDFIFSTFAPKKNGLERESDVEGSGGGGGAAAAGTGGGVGGFLPVCSRSCFLPLPFRSMLLDAITVVSEMCVHVDPSRTEYKQMKNNLGAFFRLLEMERLVTPADICAFGSSLRLDDIGWPRLVSSTSGSGGGGSGARKRVHELLIKERTKRKFTLTVYNLCREHIGMYARLHATLLAYVENNEVHIPVQACLQAIASIVGEGSLCPSRTLAIILSVYQDHLFSQNQLLPLVCLFSREKLLEVIIFQLHLYAELRKQRDAAEEEAALTIKLEPLAHAPSSPRNRSGEKTSSGPASVGGGSTSSTSSQPAATDTSLASATASVSSAEETMGIFAQQAHKAGVGGPSMNFYRMLALFIMRDMLSLNDVYPHLQPADALLAVLFERTANRYRAALTGVKSGSFPAPPKPHLTPEQHMRALLPSLMAPLTNAGRSGEGGGGPSTGVPGVGSSLGARHTGPGQPALGPGGAPVSAPPIQHGAPPSYGGLGRPLHGSGWPSSGTPYNSGVPTNAPPPHQLYGNYHVPPSGLPGGGTGMGGGGVQGSYYGSHAAGAVGGQPGSPKDREREAREKERADREAREKVEKERKQLEKDLISKEQELRSKDAGNPLLDLPGGREYLLYDEQGYRYARDKVYAMEIGKFQLLAAFLDLNGMIYAHQLMLHMMTNLSVSPAANAVVQRSLGKLIRWLVTPLLSSRPTDCLEAYLQQRKKLRPQPPVSTPPRTPASRATSGRDSFSHPGVTECQIPQSPPSSLARLIRTVNDAERFDPSPCQHASHWLGAALYWKNGGKKGQPDDTNEAHSPVKREREGDCSSPSSSLVKRVKVEESAKSPTSSPTTGETETSKWNEVPLGKQEPREDADTLPSGGRRDSGGEVKKDEMFVGLRPVRTYEDFFKHVVPLLRYLGASLAYEGETFTAILAVLRGCAEKEEEQRRSAAGAATQKDKGVPLRSQLDSMIVELIFPALSLLPYGSSAVSCKLWRLLEVLPASRRYPIYEKVIEHWTTERSHPMALNYEVVRLKLRKVLKRLTSTICEKRVKQKEKHLLGEIAAVSCIAPFPLAELCISQADLFDDNMIQTLTEATRAVCPLAADVFVSRFVQRQQLREGDDGRSSPSGTSGAGGAGQPGASYGAPKKLLNRALMTGKFLTIHYGTELLPLLVSTILRLWKDFSPAEEYISEPIKNQKALRLVGENKRYPNDLLGYYRDKEFIERLLEIMGGCPKLPEAGALTADQIYAQGGGPLLKIEVMAVDEDDSSNNGVVDTTKGVHGALLRALGRPEIFIPLLFILAKQQREILYDSDYSRSLQMFGFTLDDMHTYNLQLIDYFTRVLPCRALGSNTSSLALSPQEAPSPVKSEYGSTSLPLSLSTVSSSASFYASLLPPLRDVFAYFDPAVAWAVIRPGLPDLLTEAPSGQSTPVKGEVASSPLKSAEASPEGKTPGKKTDGGATEKDNKKTTTKEKEASPKTSTNSPAAPSLVLSRSWQGLVRGITEEYITEKQLNGLSMDFFLLFWRLSLSDIFIPNRQYEVCISRLDARMKQTQKALEDLEKQRKSATACCVDEQQCKREEDQLRRKCTLILQSHTALTREYEQHKRRYAAVRRVLKQAQPVTWFGSLGSSPTAEANKSQGEKKTEMKAKEEKKEEQSRPGASAAEPSKEGTIDTASSPGGSAKGGSGDDEETKQQKSKESPGVDTEADSDVGSSSRVEEVFNDSEEAEDAEPASSSTEVKPLRKGGPLAVQAFVKWMLAPRMLNSEADALFCSEFVGLLLELKTHLFNFLAFTNIWTKMVVPLVRCSTVREAQLLGLFVKEMLAPVWRWLKDKKAFEQETKGNTCFGRSFKDHDSILPAQLEKGAKKWETRIFESLIQGLPAASVTAATPGASSASQWVETKAVVVFLSRCHVHFPLTYKRGVELMGRLQHVVELAQAWGWKDISLSASSILKTLDKYRRDRTWHLSPAVDVDDKLPSTTSSAVGTGASKTGGVLAAQSSSSTSTNTKTSGGAKNALTSLGGGNHLTHSNTATSAGEKTSSSSTSKISSSTSAGRNSSTGSSSGKSSGDVPSSTDSSALSKASDLKRQGSTSSVSASSGSGSAGSSHTASGADDSGRQVGTRESATWKKGDSVGRAVSEGNTSTVSSKSGEGGASYSDSNRGGEGVRSSSKESGKTSSSGKSVSTGPRRGSSATASVEGVGGGAEGAAGTGALPSSSSSASTKSGDGAVDCSSSASSKQPRASSATAASRRASSPSKERKENSSTASVGPSQSGPAGGTTAKSTTASTTGGTTVKSGTATSAVAPARVPAKPASSAASSPTSSNTNTSKAVGSSSSTSSSKGTNGSSAPVTSQPSTGKKVVSGAGRKESSSREGSIVTPRSASGSESQGGGGGEKKRAEESEDGPASKRKKVDGGRPSQSDSRSNGTDVPSRPQPTYAAQGTKNNMAAEKNAVKTISTAPGGISSSATASDVSQGSDSKAVRIKSGGSSTSCVTANSKINSHTGGREFPQRNHASPPRRMGNDPKKPAVESSNSISRTGAYPHAGYPTSSTASQHIPPPSSIQTSTYPGSSNPHTARSMPSGASSRHYHQPPVPVSMPSGATQHTKWGPPVQGGHGHASGGPQSHQTQGSAYYGPAPVPSQQYMSSAPGGMGPTVQSQQYGHYGGEGEYGQQHIQQPLLPQGGHMGGGGDGGPQARNALFAAPKGQHNRSGVGGISRPHDVHHRR